MSVQTSALNLNPTFATVANWRSRILAIILMLAIAGIFWVDSRYPALLKRYHAGTQLKATGALTFGTVYQVDRSLPLSTRVWRTTVNWLDANRIGMTFSFLFGPAALTFLAMLPRRRFHSRYLNTLFGAAAGVPLAVCSNCVAPIARGLFASGMSAESVLATMFSSPALNVVVLAMTFTLFPISVALLKLATVLFLILIFVPGVASRQKLDAASIPCPIEIPSAETWPQAAAGVARSFAKSFWYVARIALPLMLLAAILGALVVELLPPQALIAQVTLGGILLVALVAAFLPVPMAFDVAIAYIAMTKGVPLPYVVTILCTLGIISVYSLSVVGKSLSWRVAAATYATVAALGTLAGLLTRMFL
ncbi:MAG TPA: permease [Candidatus Limnocylindrales bacterium]|nr:permease [Candidatus Limnocylindrales bacterium]